MSTTATASPATENFITCWKAFGEIDIGQIEVSQGKDEAMKAMAQKIIDVQKKEQQDLRGFCEQLQAVRHEAWRG